MCIYLVYCSVSPFGSIQLIADKERIVPETLFNIQNNERKRNAALLENEKIQVDIDVFYIGVNIKVESRHLCRVDIYVSRH